MKTKDLAERVAHNLSVKSAFVFAPGADIEGSKPAAEAQDFGVGKDGEYLARQASGVVAQPFVAVEGAHEGLHREGAGAVDQFVEADLRAVNAGQRLSRLLGRHGEQAVGAALMQGKGDTCFG